MRIVSFIILLLLFGCSKTTEDLNEGGIIFCFDDQYVKEWVAFKDVFDRYGIKATFFINRPQLLDSEQLAGLKILEKAGHEIACHSYNHLNSLDFKDSIESYIQQEIEPAINSLSEYGFNVTSFAFPYGKSTPKIDSVVSEYFPYIRKATWNYKATTLDAYDEIFATKESHNIINAMGIDNGYKITIENIENGIQRAKERSEVLILFAHKISTTGSESRIDPTYLESIFQLCNDNEIEAIKMNELDDFFE